MGDHTGYVYACPYVATAAVHMYNNITVPVHALYIHSFICFLPFWFGSVCRSQAGLGEPFLSEDGMVEVPVNCPLSALRDFCSKNHHKISERRREHERCAHDPTSILYTLLVPTMSYS